MTNNFIIRASQGQGSCEAAKVDTLEKALNYVKKHKKEASFAIIYPDGSYHKWE